MNQKELERLFIGSLMADERNILISDVKLDDLTTPEGVACYSGITNLYKEKKPINLQSFMLEPELFKHIGFLSECEDVGVSANFNRISSELVERSRQRLIKRRISTIDGTADDMISSLKETYTEGLRVNSDCSDMTSCLKELDSRIENNKERGSLGIPTGFEKFERLGTEYEPGQLWGIGGITNVGKTSLMIEQVMRAGLDKKIAIHSTEMKGYQLTARILAWMTGINHKLILSGRAESHELEQAKRSLVDSPLKIYDSNRDFDKMWNLCRKDNLQDGLDLVFVDYFQNMKRKGKTGYDLFSGMGKDSLELPQELELTLIMYSQITINEFKDDSGSVAFKGGGELGESCDIGLWLSKSKTKENCMLVEWRKNRHGIKKNFLLEFQGGSNRLLEVD